MAEREGLIRAVPAALPSGAFGVQNGNLAILSNPPAGFSSLNARYKKTRYAGFFISGGEGGIRTLGTLLGYNGFRDRPIQPLWHLSEPVIIRKFDVVCTRMLA